MSLKIVYLDDEPDMCELFTECISHLNFHITTFCDCEAALKYLLSNTPDLLILDYRLPGMTGDDVARKISTAIPKILITGELDVRLESKFLKIFPKPFSWEEIEKFLLEFSASKK